MSNDTIHGKLNNNLNIVKYTGKETDTAKVTVDNTERTISVDVKDGGGSSSTSDNIRIKSVKILKKPEPILTITSYPISDTIINLIKTTDTIRLMFNGLNRRTGGRRKRNTGRYYLRQDLKGFADDEITNFFKFRAPQVTEDMLIVTSKGTYIKFELHLEELLKSKIKAVSGDNVNIPVFEFDYDYYCRQPISMLAYYSTQANDIHMSDYNKVGCILDNIHNVDSPSINTTVVPVNYANKDVVTYSYSAYGLNNQLLTNPISLNNLKSIFCWDSASVNRRLAVGWYKYNNGHMTATIEEWFKKIALADNNPGLGYGYINLFNTPYLKETQDNKFKFYILGKHHNKGSKKRNNEYAVFSFGILDRNSTSHMWKKTFEKYPVVFITNYTERCKFTRSTNPISYIENSVEFEATYSVKQLPTDKKIWN